MNNGNQRRLYVIPADVSGGCRELTAFPLRFLAAEDLELVSLAGGALPAGVRRVAHRELFFSRYFRENRRYCYALWFREGAVGYSGKIYLDAIKEVHERLGVLFAAAEVGGLHHCDAVVTVIALAADSLRVCVSADD